MTTHASAAPTGAPAKDHMGTYDHNFDDVKPGDVSKREFTYLMLAGARFTYATAVRAGIMKLVSTMSASADVLALSTLEVDLDKVDLGSTITVKWRGKPVFIKHRTDKEIERESQVSLTELRDPQLDKERVQDPNWLIILGVCTHLGCVPIPNSGDFHGFFCPCHGSHYDGSGRIRKGPAPLNLEVVPYKFVEEGEGGPGPNGAKKVVIG